MGGGKRDLGRLIPRLKKRFLTSYLAVLIKILCNLFVFLIKL